MRAWPALAALLLLVPGAAAEFGAHDAHGYPLSVDGAPTFPAGVLPTGAVPDGPINAIGPLTVYPYYPVLTAELQRLASERPDLVKLHSIGKSTLGLDLWMLEIANFEAPDMLPLDEREVVWVDGGTHSNEYSGVWFATHLASFLVDHYDSNETAKWIVDHRHTWIMPLVNPDGSHAFGRLNAHAVNINRNYPVDWGANAEDPVINNPGPAPASEVETQHNIAWANATQPDLYVSVHCCGNLWLYPYGVEGLDPLDQQTLARVCAEAFTSVRDHCGPIWSTIYPASGSSVDTVYEYTGAVAFGYEMSGRNALVLWGQPFSRRTIETEEAESWNGLMHGFLNVHRYGALPMLVAASVTDDGLLMRLRNDGYGNLTNASLTRASLHPLDDPASVPVPMLAPGEEADVAVPTALAAGEHTLTLSYAKRHMASPPGLREITLTLIEGARGLTISSVDGAPVAPLAIEEAPVPAPGIGLALALLAALVLARRR